MGWSGYEVVWVWHFLVNLDIYIYIYIYIYLSICLSIYIYIAHHFILLRLNPSAFCWLGVMVVWALCVIVAGLVNSRDAKNVRWPWLSQLQGCDGYLCRIFRIYTVNIFQNIHFKYILEYTSWIREYIFIMAFQNIRIYLLFLNFVMRFPAFSGFINFIIYSFFIVSI